MRLGRNWSVPRKRFRQVIELEKEKEGRKKGTGDSARCSSTDPDARKMKMGDGGFVLALTCN